MKKHNKILSIFISIILSLSVFTACNEPESETAVNYLKGSEAAKLLLAETRLDENFLGEGIGFLGKKTDDSPNSETVSLASNSFYSNDNGFSVVGNEARWNAFPSLSTGLQAPNATISNLENSALLTSKTISEVKKHVGVTNKWLPFNGMNMLIVEENSETILTKHINGYGISRRFINENGLNEYKTVDFYDYGTVSTKYVPGSYYESMYVHVDGFTDWFVLDNSRGYWNLLRATEFDYEEDKDDCYQITNAILTEDLCVKFTVRFYKNGVFEKNNVTLIAPDLSNDVLSINYYEPNTPNSNVNISLYANAFEGISYFSTQKENVRETTVFEKPVTLPDNSFKVNVNFKNGVSISPNEYITDNIKYSYTDISPATSLSTLEDSHDLQALMIFSLASITSTNEIVLALEETINALGLTPKYSYNDIVSNLYLVDAMVENFNKYYKWNGLNLNNYQTINSVFKEIYPLKNQEFSKIYEDNKDNETLTKEELDELLHLNPNAKFSNYSSYNNGSASLENQKITISDASATMKDFTYFDVGKKYALKYGVAKVTRGSSSGISLVSNKNGANLLSGSSDMTLDDVWFLPLNNENEVIVECTTDNYVSGKAMNFSANLTFTLPEYLPKGEYVFVSYIADVEEGIRVTELKPVTFGTVEKTEITHSLGKYVAEKNDLNNLLFDSETMLDHEAKLTSLKQSYTYKEIAEFLLVEILSVGLINDSGKIEVYNITTNAYEVLLDENFIFTNEKIRIKFNKVTPLGYEEAFVYLQLNN